MINQKQIQYLTEVCKQQNITSAARNLYISQPALSRMISDIEKSIGSPLFIRDHDGVYLTQAGEIYMNACQKVMNVYDSALKEISDLQNSNSGKIVLGLSTTTGEILIPSVLEEFKKRYSQVDLRLAETHISDLEEYVKTGKIDLALTYYRTQKDFQYIPLFKDTVYIAAPRFYYENKSGWNFGFDNPKINPDDLKNQPFILLKQGRGIRNIFDRLVEQYELSPNILLETDSAHLPYHLTQIGKGFSLIPGIAARSFHATDPGVFYQIEHEPLERTLYICYRKDMYLSAAMKELIHIISEAFQ